MMQFDVAKHWYCSSLTLLTFLLLPFSWLFRLIVWLRFNLYRYGILRVYRFNVPIIVVGNLTIGGTGKTPFVIWLAHFLQSQGYKPGIVTRGVGGKRQTHPKVVNLVDQASEVGDEALLLRANANCPVVTCINRAAAVKTLLQKEDCNVVISDDGLQHYRLARSIEIVLVDGQRGLGNKQLLPAGPLREPIKRLNDAAFVVTNVSSHSSNKPHLSNKRDMAHTMHFIQQSLQSVSGNAIAELSSFISQPVHAIAGIGNPEQFFLSLEQAGLTIIRHTFPDHHLYQTNDIHFGDDLPIIMTEKDAVKCKAFASPYHWYLPIKAELSKQFQNDLLSLLSVQETLYAEKDFSYCASRHASDVNLPSTNE